MSSNIDVQDREDIEDDIELAKRWHCIMHNDDRTPFEFVLGILQSVFDKSEHEAINIAMEIHHSGQPLIVATYAFEIAEQKESEVRTASQISRYPLIVTIEQGR